MKHQIVCGHLFGDEGKGTVVNWLCLEALKNNQRPIVYLSSGGSQNAHTVKYNGIKHVFSSFGSGTLTGTPTVLDRNYMLDPICAMNEYKVLEKKGITPVFFVHPACRIITPYDVFANQSDWKNIKDGSCGKGIFKTFKRTNDNVVLVWHDCVYKFEELTTKLNNIVKYYGVEPDETYNQMFIEAVKFLKDKIKESWKPETYDVCIHECSQGLLLDMDYGIDWPHLTPSLTGLANFIKNFEYDILKCAEVFLVTRTFTTRHGASGITLYNHPEARFEVTHETNVTNQYQGNFKTGILDTRLMNRAWDRHNFDKYVRDYNIKVNLCVSHIDTFYDSKNTDNYFPYIGECGFTNKLVNSESELIKRISNELVYKPDNIFWSSTPEGKYIKY